MTIIRLFITFVYLWSFPLLLGMGTLLFFEKKLDYAKAWFLGFLMHTAIFVSLIRIGIIKGWTNRKIDIIWILFSLVIAGVSFIVCVCCKKKKKHSINRKSMIKLILGAVGIMLLTALIHVVMAAASSDTTIANAASVYTYGTPLSLDYNIYTGNCTGMITNGAYDKTEVFTACYYACISTIAGAAPATVIRFIASALIIMETVLGIYLITTLIWPDNKKALKVVFTAFTIIELSILFSNRGEMLQLLTTTWSADVISYYVFVPALLYAFLMLQSRLFDSECKLYLTIIETVIWVILLLFCGNMWIGHIRIIMVIWCGLFAVTALLRRYVFRD